MKRKLEYLLSIPKTIYFNFKVFDYRTAMKCPIYIHYRTTLGKITRNSIVLDQVYRGGIRIGFEGTDGVKNCEGKSFIEIGRQGLVHFKGRANFGRNATIRVNGSVEIGKNFSINCNSFISVHSSLNIGDDFLGGWNITMLDSDNHRLEYEEHENHPKQIKVGNNVWICSFVDIMKGSVVSDDSVVGYRSLVNRKFNTPRVMLAGCPAKVIKTEINWSR